MPKVSESKENLVTASNSVENLSDVENQRNKRFGEPDEITEVSLTQTEKQFLLSAERGDCATVKRSVFIVSYPVSSSFPIFFNIFKRAKII